MSFILDLKDIEKEPVITFLLNVVLLVSSGVSWVFYFSPQTFRELDIFKLIILSVAYFILPAFINSVIFIFFFHDTFPTITFGIFVTTFVSFIVLVVSYFFNFQINSAIIFMLALSVLVDFLLTILVIFFRKK